MAVGTPVEARRDEARHALAGGRHGRDEVVLGGLRIDDDRVPGLAQHLDVVVNLLQLALEHFLVHLGRALEAEEKEERLAVADAGGQRRVHQAHRRIVAARAGAPLLRSGLLARVTPRRGDLDLLLFFRFGLGLRIFAHGPRLSAGRGPYDDESSTPVASIPSSAPTASASSHSCPSLVRITVP